MMSVLGSMVLLNCWALGSWLMIGSEGCDVLSIDFCIFS